MSAAVIGATAAVVEFAHIRVEYFSLANLHSIGKYLLRLRISIRRCIVGHNVDYDTISVKTPEQIAMLRVAGGIAARALEGLTPHIKPDATSILINDIAHDLIVNKYGAEIDREDLSGYDSSEFAAVSIAHNEIAFSGEPSEIPLRTGDLFGVDVSLKKDGWCGDTQRMWIVGDETATCGVVRVGV